MKKILLVVFLFITFFTIFNFNVFAKSNFNKIKGYEKVYFKNNEYKLLDFYTSDKDLNIKDYPNKQEYEKDTKDKLKYFEELNRMKGYWFGLNYKILNKDFEIKFIKKTLKEFTNSNNSDDKVKYEYQNSLENAYKYNFSGTMAQQADLSFPASKIIGKLKNELKISTETNIQKTSKTVEKLEFFIPKNTKYKVREVGVGFVTNGVFSYNIFKISVFSGNFQIIEETSSYYEYILEAI